MFCSFLDNVEIIVNEIRFLLRKVGVTERVRSLNPITALAMAIILVLSARARCMAGHGVAWRGMWICVRSEDAQKQLARTSLILRQSAKHDLFHKYWDLSTEMTVMKKSFCF